MLHAIRLAGVPSVSRARYFALGLVAVMLVAGIALIGRPASTQRGPTYHSPLYMALSPDQATLYVTDHTADGLCVLSAKDGSLVRTVSIPAPTGVAASPDGTTVYVASSSQDRVYEVDAADGRIRGSLGVGRHPVGLAVSPDGATVYCCNQFTDDISVIDAANMAESRRLKAIREPRFVAITPAGDRLVVANQLPQGSNLDDSLAAEATVIDLPGGETVAVKLSLGATDVGQVCCSPDGRFAYIPHVLARWLVPPTQLDRGWIATNALTIIDLREKKRVNTVLLDDLDRGAANPQGITISPDGARLYVTHAGSHEIQVIDRGKLHKLIDEWPADAPTELENDLTAVYRAGVRTRVPCGGVGPRAAAATSDAVFAANYYSGDITRLPADGKGKPTLIALGNQPEMDSVRRGEMLFNDARICFQGWQSCATCHPEGRADGLAWDLLNDGIGNPKNAKSLLLSGPTPPVMAHGVRGSMEIAVGTGLKYILFHVPMNNEIPDIAAYIDAMKPERSPYRNADGSLSEAAMRGKAIFEREDVQCAKCHPAPLYTDLQTYEVGTRGPYDRRDDFDTPTLIEMFRTAPYLHDGSAVTMMDVLTTYNKNDKHGVTSHLSQQELKDLAEYLLSL